MPLDIKQIVKRYEQGKIRDYQFRIHFQVLAEYFMTRKADFTVNFTPGQFLNKDLFDSTGPKAANVMAGSLEGMIWPENSINFRLKPARNISKTQEVKNYFDEISARLHSAMVDPECGLSLARGEYSRDRVTFGSAGIAVFEPEDKDCHFLFQAWDVKRMVIYEGPNGIVNRVYYEREETIEQCVKEFGLKNLSDKSQKAYSDKQYDTKINILHAVEPRLDRNPKGLGNLDMPVASIYIELGENKLIKESGFPQMQVFVNRFYKNIREILGRSPAMDALPDVLELNALREAEIVATEKLLDPPLGVLDDGRLGAGSIDTSAGAINVFNVSGRIGNQPPIFPINTVGEMKSLKERIEELKQSVSDHFLIDRLLDMQNETEMTLGEVMERQKMRAFVLNPIFARGTAEVDSPLIKTCFNMLLAKGELGVMPGSHAHITAVMFGDPVLVIPVPVAQAILSGQNVYDIQYMTPAARMMASENVQGVLNTWKFMNDVAQTQPEIFDNADEDVAYEIVADGFGAPREMNRSADAVAQIRNARAQQQQEKQKFEQGIETAKAMGHLKGLAPQAPAPGVVNSSIGAPVNV